MDKAVPEIIALAKQGKQAEAIALMKNGDYTSAAAKLDSDFDRMIEIKLQVAEETAINNTAIATTSTLITIVLIIGGMILSILLGLFIAATIKKPINKMVDASKGWLTAISMSRSISTPGMKWGNWPVPLIGCRLISMR